LRGCSPNTLIHVQLVKYRRDNAASVSRISYDAAGNSDQSTFNRR
jgi:hypothetical protein